MTGLLPRFAVPIVVAGAILLAAAGLAYLTLATVRGMIDDARTSTASERNAFWAGEIERGNAEANRRIAEQATKAMQIQADATERLRQVEQQFAEKEALNAALPHGDDRGLGRDRVRLLAR